MEKDQKTGEGQTASQEVDAKQTETTSMEDVVAKLKALEATNARLLKESQEYKTKAKTLMSQQEQKEKEELEGKEKFKEAYQLSQKKIASMNDEIGKLKRININTSLDAELAKLAHDAHSIDDVKKFLSVDILDITEENDGVKISGLKEALDLTRKEKPYLFKPAMPAKQVTAKPGTQKQEPLDLNKMDVKTLASMLASKH